MPQMSPLLWLNLYVFFFLIFMLFVMMNYFTYTPSMKEQETLKYEPHQMNWKW
uniref:ATP synthase complex subunit 8 n=3 Tax=Gonodactylidae TaxID=75391 RepID=A0A8K1S8R8_9CRUS|nr:ATP synthase F0 subunit 8 [Gonodactylus smithii]YP_337839.1 ATP synthase F0 subunit 8 [Gonodactylus chiragra]ABA18051.1 ATP synthase F0 subunit 8 [Gonodactylus chiragra]QTK16222.1 ATP synthase F0 subunit 8 [Gonodactylus smithii]UEV86992.1 ATP synthase F0 subunit 8 [Gonodactylellus affinis]